jgi:hypothetical protein
MSLSQVWSPSTLSFDVSVCRFGSEPTPGPESLEGRGQEKVQSCDWELDGRCFEGACPVIQRGQHTPRANLVQTCRRKRLPLVARTGWVLNVFSNSYRALPLSAGPSGRFEPRRPRHPFPCLFKDFRRFSPCPSRHLLTPAPRQLSESLQLRPPWRRSRSSRRLWCRPEEHGNKSAM